MKIAMVVFDLAGTTVNDGDAVNRVLRDALAASGVMVDRDAVNSVMGLPKPIAIRTMIALADPQDSIAGHVDAVHEDFVARMMRFYEDDPVVAEFAGTSSTFRSLRDAGIKIAIDTGFSRDITAIILKRLGWERAGLVDASITSDEVPNGRPYPDMIHELMRRLEIQDARKVAKIGDTPSDLEEGARAGCGRVIGVWGGSHSREQLALHPHTDLIATVADLPSLLGLPHRRT